MCPYACMYRVGQKSEATCFTACNFRVVLTVYLRSCFMVLLSIYFNAHSLILCIQLIVADNNRCRRLETRQTQDSTSRSVRPHLMLSTLTSIQHKNLSRNTPMSDERTIMHYRADLHSTDIAAEAVAPPSAEYIVNFTGNKRIKNRATLCVSAVFAVGRCLSVRPSVHLLRSCIVSKRLNVFLGLIAPLF